MLERVSLLRRMSVLSFDAGEWATGSAVTALDVYSRWNKTRQPERKYKKEDYQSHALTVSAYRVWGWEEQNSADTGQGHVSTTLLKVRGHLKGRV